MSTKRIIAKLYKNRFMKLLRKPTMIVIHDDYFNNTTMLRVDEYNRRKKQYIFIKDNNIKHMTIKQVIGL